MPCPQVILQQKGISDESYWMWLGFVGNVGLLAFYFLLTYLAMCFIEFPPALNTNIADLTKKDDEYVCILLLGYRCPAL